MNKEPMSVAELDIMKEVRRLVQSPECPTSQDGCLPLAAATYAILGSTEDPTDLPWSGMMDDTAPQNVAWPWMTRQPEALPTRRERLVRAAAFLVLEANAIDAQTIARMAGDADNERFPRKYRNKVA